MTFTYRDLLNAIKMAEALQESVSIASSNPKRWKGSITERDAAESEFRAAEMALDEEVAEFN